MIEDRPWVLGLCRGSPGAEDVADIAAARGARIRWCGADCPHDCGDSEDDL